MCIIAEFTMSVSKLVRPREENEEEWKCDKCGKIFPTSKARKRHQHETLSCIGGYQNSGQYSLREFIAKGASGTFPVPRGRPDGISYTFIKQYNITHFFFSFFFFLLFQQMLQVQAMAMCTWLIMHQMLSCLLPLMLQMNSSQRLNLLPIF